MRSRRSGSRRSRCQSEKNKEGKREEEEERRRRRRGVRSNPPVDAHNAGGKAVVKITSPYMTKYDPQNHCLNS